MSHTHVVTSVRACLKAMQEIMQYTVVAVDCEGVNLSKSGKLCLIQVATPKKVYLFDILKGGEKMFAGRGLCCLLENDQVVKVMHDCRRDSEALHYQFNVCLRGVWDSQVAHTVLSQFKGFKTPYPIGLNTLLRTFGCEENKFKDSVKFTMSAMKNFWEVRPMSRMMIDYAASDVSYLLKVHTILVSELAHFALGYDHKKILEHYSNKYLEMNLVRAEDGGANEAKDLGKVPMLGLNPNFYGIEFWDADIGYGTREENIFAEYDIYFAKSDCALKRDLIITPR